MIRRIPAWSLVASLALALACATVRNYTDPAGPRFAGSFGVPGPARAIKVVTFNVKFARHVDRAVEVLRETEVLRGADVITMQEMDEAGTDRVARALGLNYVYYPGSRRAGKNFGNAILSPWPIQDDVKVLLPSRPRFGKLQRIAVAATVKVGELPLRVFSVHLDSPLATGGLGRRSQAGAVLEQASRSFEHVVVAGDFNNRGIVGPMFQSGGFAWLTRRVGHTISLWSWDHVFARGLRLQDCASVGVVRNNRGASDHKPVWAIVVPADGPAPDKCP
ncbi:MAG TPA: endonuclease/exonuclease/phosphatase family protein [Vicinamibacteria bacterium]